MKISESIAEILQKNEKVQFAYLFGSYARGDELEGSDVDIAVYFTLCEFDLGRRLTLAHTLEKAVSKRIDMVVLNEVKNYDLLKNIIDEGVVIKESKDDSRVIFELRKYHEILDYKAFRKSIDAA
ncbi:MAG TPA: nucleotidyltransferase domain-containing protein [Epsilonproteobacteria bacterium]|nr:nucleotidyltransferase domain-containing protein [Campylobacterota bacterium]HHH37190.1 nucleotidyltransferase domain-containing protein [Campylobacterota bacterium]